jgi:hypothetical protein
LEIVYRDQFRPPERTGFGEGAHIAGIAGKTSYARPELAAEEIRK